MYQGRFMWERYSVIIKCCLWLKMQQNCLNSGPLKRKNLVKLSGLHIKCVEPFLPYFPDGLRLWGCWLCLRTGHLRLPENQTMLSRVHDPQVPKLIAIKRHVYWREQPNRYTQTILITALFCSPDEVSSIGFHQDRPVVAFGSTGGCVHLFSLCWQRFLMTSKSSLSSTF